MTIADVSYRIETWYLLTSADHNIVQINRLESDGRVGELQSDLRKPPTL